MAFNQSVFGVSNNYSAPSTPAAPKPTTAGSHGSSSRPPKPPKPPKPKKPQYYDPMHPSRHTLAYYQAQARSQAQNDINSQLAALPKDAFYTNAAQGLSQALQKIASQAGSFGASAGGLYNQAYQAGAAPTSAAAAASGGNAVNPVGATAASSGTLLGALGAMMGQALEGGVQGAISRGHNDVLANEAKASAIRAQQGSLYDQKLQALLNQVLQQSVAGSNADIAAGQLGVSQQNADTGLYSATHPNPGTDPNAKAAAAAKKALLALYTKRSNEYGDMVAASKKGTTTMVWEYDKNGKNPHQVPQTTYPPKPNPFEWFKRYFHQFRANGASHALALRWAEEITHYHPPAPAPNGTPVPPGGPGRSL